MNSSGPPSSQSSSPLRWYLLLAVTLAATFAYFYFFVPIARSRNQSPTLIWMAQAWNSENRNYEHGWIVVLIQIFFIWKAIPKMRAEPLRGSAMGWLWIAAGLVFWVGGFRGIQVRATILSLPFLLLGGAHFAFGWKVARHLVFPLSLFVFMIPLPGFEQRTSDLAVLSCQLARIVSGWIGIQTLQFGTILKDPNQPAQAADEWVIDDGCSGIRSLMALMLITYAYAMVVHGKWWERIVIFACALPVAVVANAVRITTILIVARMLNPTLARYTWHDYSGFLSFGAALCILMLISALMRRGFRFFKPKVVVTRVGQESAAT